jgi:hypothetical protein
MNTQQHERALVVAAGRLQGLVLDLVREIQADAAVERRARYDGDQFPELVPTPLAGLWAANNLAVRASREVATHARRARESGHSWDEIGQALGVEPGDGRSVAEATFERFAGSPTSWSLRDPSFVWRCKACDRVISDRGPYESHPDDNQPGHAKDCSRLAAELARWRSSWDVSTVQTRVVTTEQGMDL